MRIDNLVYKLEKCDYKTWILLSLGYINVTNENGNTPLIFAVSSKKFELAKLLLLCGANTEIKDKINDWPPIIYASYYYYYEIVELLLKYGADTEIKMSYGCTPLIYASNKDEIDLVKLLLKYGADVNAKDINGNTALYYAKLKIIKELLVKAGAK